MNKLSRQQIIAQLRAQVSTGTPIIGAGAGTGISGKCAEAGGADLIVIYNSGRYRMAGHGSLSGLMPYGDANAIVVEMSAEVLPVVKDVPVLAGVCGTDPFRIMELFIEQIKVIGFSGVQNFPTVGLIDGVFRQNLEETGMSYAKEIDMIGIAHDLDLLTTPYVFDASQAVEMTRAGADILVAHMGLTTKGTIGAKTALTLEDCVARIREIYEAARTERDDALVICHGGPISEPADAQYIMDKLPGIAGFFGASSVERLPTEVAISQRVRDFKAMKPGQESL